MRALVAFGILARAIFAQIFSASLNPIHIYRGHIPLLYIIKIILSALWAQRCVYTGVRLALYTEMRKEVGGGVIYDVAGFSGDVAMMMLLTEL
jgi:hypothetical protein